MRWLPELRLGPRWGAHYVPQTLQSAEKVITFPHSPYERCIWSQFSAPRHAALVHIITVSQRL